MNEQKDAELFKMRNECVRMQNETLKD